jgi:hypothetical protein
MVGGPHKVVLAILAVLIIKAVLRRAKKKELVSMCVFLMCS